MATPTTGFNWVFQQEVEVPSEVSEMLVNGEEAVAAYKTVRDIAVFTNKRLIVRDKQGITGKKIEIYSIPYSSINMYSTENSGTFDLSSEIQLWTRAGEVKISLKKGLDVRKLDKLIAEAIL